MSYQYVSLKNNQTPKFTESHLDTLALGQTNPRLVAADDENVALPSGERIVNGVLDVNDVETTIVPLAMRDHTNTTHITTTSHHGNDTSVELDEVLDLASAEIDLHGIVDFDVGIGVTDPARSCISTFLHKIQPKLGPTAERWQQTHVRASCVTKNGIPPFPNCTRRTLPSLYAASSDVMRWTVKRPLVS